MPIVKLVGGFADGSITYVSDSVDVIYIPRSWGRRGYRGPTTRDELRNVADSEAYRRSGQFDADGAAVFVAESAAGLSDA